MSGKLTTISVGWVERSETQQEDSGCWVSFPDAEARIREILIFYNGYLT